MKVRPIECQKCGSMDGSITTRIRDNDYQLCEKCTIEFEKRTCQVSIEHYKKKRALVKRYISGIVDEMKNLIAEG